MALSERLKKSVPEPLKAVLRPVRNRFVNKYTAATAFWRGRYEHGHGVFDNAYYRPLMLAMADEPDDEFLRGKIVADFGCGPKGSLIWAASASQRIGIDVLAARYAEEFTSQMIAHGMIYVTCTERVIPLPSDFVDVLFTLNAIDHVDSFPAMCSEILRIIKPGGDFIGSFNLEEPPTPTEPQRLTEKSIKENLLDALVVRSYRVASHAAGENRYGPFLMGSLSYERGKKGTLWVRAGKPPSTPLP